MSTSSETVTARADAATACRVLEEIFPAADEVALAEVISPEFVTHEAPVGTPPGPAGITMLMRMLAAAFSDQKWTMEKVLVDGDTVALYCVHSGRHTGTFLGLPATGREFAYKQMHMIRIKDGLGAEHWAVRDDAGLMRQLRA